MATYDGDGNLKQRFEYTVGHTPSRFTQDGETYYILASHLGSPRAIVDSSGEVIREIQYDAYGNVIEDSNPEFSIPFGFAGGLNDEHTGLIRFGYRDYDPRNGRWTARDPVGFAGGDLNLYGYVLNDPINRIDPFGLSSLIYDDHVGVLTIISSSGESESYPAANNAQSSSAGPFPEGVFEFSWHSPHSGSGPSDPFGSYGNFIFEVPDRQGMGVHSGREGQCDLANQCGIDYSTNGCIRTSDDAMQKIHELHYGGDPIQNITVIR
nr:RHS repeat-associated core domain-containing protein [Natronospira proteinivora]